MEVFDAQELEILVLVALRRAARGARIDTEKLADILIRANPLHNLPIDASMVHRVVRELAERMLIRIRLLPRKKSIPREVCTITRAGHSVLKRVLRQRMATYGAMANIEYFFNRRAEPITDNPVAEYPHDFLRPPAGTP